MAVPPSSSKPSRSGGDPGDAVAEARTRARRRLVGAVVLLGIGIVAFPLVFETRPRPIPVDVPIEIPRREGAPPLVVPGPRAPARPANVVSPPDDGVITESRSEAGRELPARPATAASSPGAASGGAHADVPRPAAAAASAPAAPAAKPSPATQPARSAQQTAAPTAQTADAARAKALLEGEQSPGGAAAAPRYVVQVGAFSDASSVREVRARVEKLGLKTYTQVAETASGSRTRVRVGPFASREDAERAQAKARAAGIDAVVLTL